MTKTTKNIKRNITRKRDGRFCTIEIEVKNGRLSVCGVEGRVTQRAEFVLETDDDLHGAEIGDEILVTESCGQIRETLREWFPEAAPLLPWHLNDMHAECEHQQARGETYQTHPMATCPDCGYRLGSAWLSRALPPEIIALAETVAAK